MLILIFSDSHGHTDAMLPLAAVRRADLLIHLGDNQRDVRAVARAMPDLSIISVPGNCDFSRDPPVLTHSCENLTLLITHGHQHRVKSGLNGLASAARAAKAQIALFGHTHMPHHEDAGGLLLFNPGSIALPRAGPRTYGLIEIDGARWAAQAVPYV